MAKRFYSYQEAMRKVHDAGIKTRSEYQKWYKIDPMLPAKPWIVYSEHYENSEFFSKTGFYTYEEALQKVNEAGVKSTREYKQWHKLDPRMPSHPWAVYGDEFNNDEFFYKSKRGKFYTYEEAIHKVHEARIKSTAEYRKWQKSDPRLPAQPKRFYGDEFDNAQFFGKPQKKPIYSYREAMHRVQQAGIKSTAEYKHWQRADPRMPASPWYVYDGEFDNIEFFGKPQSEGFYTYQEAMQKVQQADVKSTVDYKQYQRSDPRLPSNPWHVYGKEFDNATFFAKESFYSYQEAMRKVHDFKIKTKSEYLEWQKLDSKLPSQPQKTYGSEFDHLEFFAKELSIEEFAEQVKKKGVTKKIEYDKQLVGTSPIYPKDPVKYYGVDSFKSLIKFDYWGLDETRKYINAHKIKTSYEYIEHAKVVPHLRAHPNKIEGFIGELHYYRTKPFEVFLEQYPNFKPWCDVAKIYLVNGSNIAKRTSIIEKFLNWLAESNIEGDPLAFLINTSRFPDVNKFLASLSKQEQSTNTIGIVNDYLNLVLKTYCTDEDEETGEIFWHPDYRNPYINQSLDGVTRDAKPNETVKKILPFAYVDKARKFLCPYSANSFSDLDAARDIYQSDYYEVDESHIDKNDPNCVWRTREVFRSSGRRKTIIYEMWSPVRTVAMLTLFELPIRGQQILWNDSGEWDKELPHYRNGQLVWEKNLRDVQNHFKIPQGFINRYDEDSFGFYCTTNKTKNAEGGYAAPYMPDHLAKWLILLRDWQMKYNPITSPTKWSNDFMQKGSHVSKTRLRRRGYEGQQCFLFRDPTAKNEVLRSRPLTKSALRNGLPILLHHIQDEQIKLASFDDTPRWDGSQMKTMSRYSSEYSPHSLRASIITAYLVDHKLSPVLVSKLVGHASLVMTIYYAKVTAPAMKREFERAEFEALKNKQNSINDAVMAAKFKNLKASYVDNTNGEFLTKLEGITGNAIVDKGCGICPLGGQSCHEGGELVAEKSTYRSPVPTSLVLGRSNCVRCRFFITSPVYLPGLKALFDSIALSIRDLNDRIEEVSEQLENLKDERDECECAGQSFTKTFELNRLQSVYETSVASLDGAMSDAIATYRLSDAVINLLNDETPDANDKKLPMVLNDSTLSIELRESSKFEQLHEICQYADLFMFSDPKAAVMERTQKINKMLLENDISASLYSLTLEQQKLIGNHLINNLVRRLGGWNELDNVAEKRTKLRDYLPAVELKSLTTEIKNLSNSIPIRNEALPEGEPSL